MSMVEIQVPRLADRKNGLPLLERHLLRGLQHSTAKRYAG
jgi:DNA-binding NtrC family response regulator